VTGQSGYVLPSEPSTEPIRRLVAYWRSKCRDGQLPGRGDVDPCDLAFILPSLFLMDVAADEEPSRRFRFGLFGTELTRMHGRDQTGRTFHEVLEPEPAAGAVAHAMRLVRERRPLFVVGKTLYLPDKQWLDFENCMLPLVDAAGDVTMILGATIYIFPSKSGKILARES
jgi:hypothetical protein